MDIHNQRAKFPFAITHLSLTAVILISYSIFFWMDFKTIYGLGYEDGFFEYLTALLFLLASLLMLKAGFKSGNGWYFALFLLLFVGAGEEISWGQRLIGIETPEELKKMNVQGEINLHNLEVFNRENFDKSVKTGIEKLLTVNTLYRLFIMFYGVIIPVLVIVSPMIKKMLEKIRVPLIPLNIGIYFFIAWIGFRLLNNFRLTEDIFFAGEEIFESLTAWVWFAIGFNFITNANKKTT